VGAGFRSLCALGLLPGRVTSLADAGADADADSGDPPPPALAHLRVEGRSTPFTSAIPAGRVISLAGSSAAAAPGLRYDVAEPAALEARGQVIFRYCDAAGGTRARVRSPIAGVCGEAGNVVGLLAGPAALEGDVTQLLGSLRMHLAGKR
jgi:phosphoribosylformylglycinamidine (FGAM) synthase-like amidotransferase family enzyme